jgi:hypothetical protein
MHLRGSWLTRRKWNCLSAAEHLKVNAYVSKAGFILVDVTLQCCDRMLELFDFGRIGIWLSLGLSKPGLKGSESLSFAPEPGLQIRDDFPEKGASAPNRGLNVCFCCRH